MDPILPGVLNGDVEPGRNRWRQLVGRGEGDALAGTVSGFAGIQVGRLDARRSGLPLGDGAASNDGSVATHAEFHRFGWSTVSARLQSCQTRTCLSAGRQYSGRACQRPLQFPPARTLPFPAPPRCRARCSDAYRTKRPWA